MDLVKRIVNYALSKEASIVEMMRLIGLLIVPLGCVPNGLNDLFYLNDGWLDCVDGSDEADAVPTTLEDCSVYDYVPCDTVYVEIPIIDTLYVTEYIDCISGLPCGNTAILELLQKTKNNNKIYNLNGKEIYRRENVYIENGKINFKIK